MNVTRRGRLWFPAFLEKRYSSPPYPVKLSPRGERKEGKRREKERRKREGKERGKEGRCNFDYYH